jgi:thiosulfate dehydrogenase (quinone) large subunit
MTAPMLSRRRFVAALAAVVAAIPGSAWAAPKPKPKKKPVKKKPVKKPAPKPTATPTTKATPTPSATQTPAPSPTPQAIIAVSELRVGTAKIVATSRDGRDVTVAVSRTSAGFVVVDAVCTHAGCIVQVASDNDLLCLCHRSRFDRLSGAVLDSPAIRPLQRYDVEVRGEYLYFR